MFAQQRLRRLASAFGGVHQCQADDGAGTRVTQRQRIVEALTGRRKATVGEIGVGKRPAQIGIARIERDGGFRLLQRLFRLARLKRFLRVA